MSDQFSRAMATRNAVHREYQQTKEQPVTVVTVRTRRATPIPDTDPAAEAAQLIGWCRAHGTPFSICDRLEQALADIAAGIEQRIEKAKEDLAFELAETEMDVARLESELAEAEAEVARLEAELGEEET